MTKDQLNERVQDAHALLTLTQAAHARYAGGEGSGVKGHTTPHDIAVRDHEAAMKAHEDVIKGHIDVAAQQPHESVATKDAPAVVDVHTKQDELSDNELEIIAKYTGSAFSALNPILRGSGTVDSYYTDLVPTIDAAIAKSKTVENATLYRGVSDQAGFSTAKVGDLITDAGYGSLTAKKSVAGQFANAHSGQVVQVQVPAGSNLLDVGAAFAPKHGPGAEFEAEHLLPRGTSYRVVQNDKKAIILKVEHRVKTDHPLIRAAKGPRHKPENVKLIDRFGWILPDEVNREKGVKPKVEPVKDAKDDPKKKDAKIQVKRAAKRLHRFYTLLHMIQAVGVKK